MMQSNWKIVSAGLLAVAVAGLAAGCAAPPQRESTGQVDELQVQPLGSTVGRVIDDSTLTAKVKAALVANPDTKARDIDVTISHGVVQLSGLVDTREQRDAAAEVARSVTGVRSVDNGLQLKPQAQ